MSSVYKKTETNILLLLHSVFAMLPIIVPRANQHRLITYLSIRKASLLIDRLIDLGLNSDDVWIDHMLLMLHDK
jgi:hypothetical protein